MMFRVLANDVVGGGLGCIALVLPSLRRPVMQRALEHRQLDGDAFEVM
jgi:hypothetical protein